MLNSLPRPDSAYARRILFASLVGTTIEYYDFYIYGTAAALVFPRLFFPKGDAATALLQSFATFALAFFSRGPLDRRCSGTSRRPHRTQGNSGHRPAHHGVFQP